MLIPPAALITIWALGYVAANEFLRWVDLLNILVIPLVSTVAG